ncbi:MAG: hypothetical protein WA952_16535 [Lewinella sp.]
MPRLIIVLLLVVATQLSAQELYNVRIGTFQDVRADDFAELNELGFVYGLPMDGQLTDVYIGNYSSEERAAEVTSNLIDRGFRNAAPFALPVSGAEPAEYVQVALRGRGRELNWSELERAGTLHVDAADGATKVVAGPYPSEDAADEALAMIRELGYGDAFTRTIQPGRLVAVGLFETGIKKPLIPIDLSRPPVRPSATRDSISPAPPPPAPAPAARQPDTLIATTAAVEPSGEAALATAVRPVPVSQPSLPEIDVDTKRHSAAELQRVLKEKDYYQGSIDGFYGPGTRSAFESAWNELEELKNYRLIAGMEEPTSGPVSWPEMLVLSVIAEDMAAGLANLDRDTELANERSALLQTASKLSAAASSEARSWESTVWSNLNDWAIEDPLHARLLSALRVAYYQSQVRLEAMYQQRGLSPIESRDLATAALRNVLAADLDRFL